MRLLIALTLSLATASAAFTQGTPPVRPGPPRPPTPEEPCYQLKWVEVIDSHNRWARIRTGDEWISGCLGPDGVCAFPVWVRC